VYGAPMVFSWQTMETVTPVESVVTPSGRERINNNISNNEKIQVWVFF
jgi:hypothetical protein